MFWAVNFFVDTIISKVHLYILIIISVYFVEFIIIIISLENLKLQNNFHS